MPLVKFFLSILKLYFTWKENKQLYFKYTSKYGHYNYTVFYSNSFYCGKPKVYSW